MTNRPEIPKPSPELQSGVLIPPGERPLSAAIGEVLRAPAKERAALFMARAREIQDWVAAHHPDQPWTCAVYRGTDGSHIFRGGVGHSLVIDAEGRLWRARSYEDFATTYDLTASTCVIATLTPLYGQMRECLSVRRIDADEGSVGPHE